MSHYRSPYPGGFCAPNLLVFERRSRQTGRRFSSPHWRE